MGIDHLHRKRNSVMKNFILELITNLASKFLTDEMIAEAKGAVIRYLRALAAKTETEIDDALVDMVERAMEVDPK